MRRQQRTLEAGPEPASVVADERKAEEAGMALQLEAGGNTKQRRPGRQRDEGRQGRGGELEEGCSGNLASMVSAGGGGVLDPIEMGKGGRHGRRWDWVAGAAR